MANDPVNTAVFNLSDEPVPPEVFTLLSKRMGFVPTTKHDPLSMRNDCRRTMAKLAMITKSKIDKTNFNNEPLPKSLKREKHLLVEKSGDSVIDQIIPEVIKEVDCLSLDAKVKDNLNPAEKKGMNWLTKQVTYGDLRVVKADKGGAVCIVPKSTMRKFELDKLDKANHYENMGADNPCTEALHKLLDIWRLGEDDNFVSRRECYEVMGLCAKKDGKPQRLSTSNSFQPKHPIFMAY